MSAKGVTGTVKTVTSLTNPLVKSLRALHLKKHREETGLFLAEGLQLVRYAIEANWKIEDIDEGLMIAWFANYWAAVHDPLQEKIDRLGRAIVSNHIPFD